VVVRHSVTSAAVNTVRNLVAVRALIASKPGAPKPTPIDRYVRTHPAAMRFVAEMPPPPQSYVTSTYHMINAFAFTNAAGQHVVGRYHILPRAGLLALDPNLVPTRSVNYLAEELTKRLEHDAAYFDIIVQIADPSDQTHEGRFGRRRTQFLCAPEPRISRLNGSQNAAGRDCSGRRSLSL
jgi:hypothetical protein